MGPVLVSARIRPLSIVPVSITLPLNKVLIFCCIYRKARPLNYPFDGETPVG